jgi:hypothetical protein
MLLWLLSWQKKGYTVMHESETNFMQMFSHYQLICLPISLHETKQQVWNHTVRDGACLLKRWLESPFRLIAANCAFLEHLYYEMAAKTSFHWHRSVCLAAWAVPFILESLMEGHNWGLNQFVVIPQRSTIDCFLSLFAEAGLDLPPFEMSRSRPLSQVNLFRWRHFPFLSV